MLMLSALVGGLGVLISTVLVAADAPYAGRWRVNADKSDYGPAFTFAPEESGALRLTQGDRSYIVRFDGKEYPHPLGGLARWTRIDDRTWEFALTQNGKIIGDAIYRLSDDGRTLTRQPKSGRGDTIVYRRTSGEPEGLVGSWSIKTAPVVEVDLQAAEGYDLVFSSGPTACKANFDGRDYSILGPDGKPSEWETCAISKVGDHGFSLTVKISGKPVAIDTFTVSEDGKTLTQRGGSIGRPPNYALVFERQR
jgi:hypothetical protein